MRSVLKSSFDNDLSGEKLVRQVRGGHGDVGLQDRAVSLICRFALITSWLLKNLFLLSHSISVNTLPPKYAPKQEEEKADG